MKEFVENVDSPGHIFKEHYDKMIKGLRLPESVIKAAESHEGEGNPYSPDVPGKPCHQ